MSGADIAAVCNEASMLALKSTLTRSENDISKLDLSEELITLLHFKDAIVSIKKRIKSQRIPQDPSFI